MPAVSPPRAGPAALHTSDALGAAAVQLGPQAVAVAVILNKQCGRSFGRIRHLLRVALASR